jgi:phenylalanyl-tRNA synthetase beta chain
MKITWNWLAEFVELQMPLAPLAERLVMAGFEVESVEERGRELADVVCAEIVQVRPHPDAERLTVCDLRIADDASVSVVCGANNLRAGDRAAYAPPGATLPGGRRIEATAIRGVSSAGMLCSAAELGVGPDAAGILILAGEAGIGTRIGTILGLEDTVLDISVTPNRGDCLSILGMAREIAALTGQPLRRPRLSVREANDTTTAELISIRIADPDLCGRYVGRIISGLRIAPSPLWMQSRLQAVGVRPINTVVDITNYVMIERGQPLHAFDYDRLPAKEIVVRRAATDAPFTTLDGQTRRLHADDLLITCGGGPIAIAGVMGGTDSEVLSSTQRVLLESAWFAPNAVRRTAKRLGLRTEASYRFERSTDIEGVAVAADRAAALLAKLAGGSVAPGRVDVYPSARAVAPIALRLKRVDDLLGMSVSRTEVVSRLKALGLAVSPATRGTVTVIPPPYRADLSREVDLIEEIARLGGYENVPTRLPESALAASHLSLADRRQRDLKRYLAAQGLDEAVCLSFCSPRANALFAGFGERRTPVTVLNPVAQDEPELRLSVCSGLARIVRDNLDQGLSQVGAFCIAKVFWRDGGFHEAWRIGGAIGRAFPSAGLGSRTTAAEFADVKGVVEGVLDVLAVRDVRWTAAPDLPAFHPGKTARLDRDGEAVGIVGCLHPAVEEELKIAGPCWQFELDLDRLLQYGPRRVVFRDLPRFPVVVRDVAIVADESFPSDRVVDFVRQWSQSHPLIEDVHLFDQYVGAPIPPGKKSLAYSLSFRAPERTLTDSEVNDAHAELIAALKDALPVEPR